MSPALINELSVLVNALTMDATANTTMAWRAFHRNDLITENNRIDRKKVLFLLESYPGRRKIQRMEGIGKASYVYLIQLLLENHPKIVE